MRDTGGASSSGALERGTVEGGADEGPPSFGSTFIQPALHSRTSGWKPAGAGQYQRYAGTGEAEAGKSRSTTTPTGASYARS